MSRFTSGVDRFRGACAAAWAKPRHVQPVSAREHAEDIPGHEIAEQPPDELVIELVVPRGNRGVGGEHDVIADLVEVRIHAGIPQELEHREARVTFIQVELAQ